MSRQPQRGGGRTMWTLGASLVVVGSLVWMAACSGPTSTGRRGDEAGAGWEGVAEASRSALAPERVVIHPLTRVVVGRDQGGAVGGGPVGGKGRNGGGGGSGGGGGGTLVCLFELKDRFGQSIKSLGRVRVEMFGRTTSGESANGAMTGEGATTGELESTSAPAAGRQGALESRRDVIPAERLAHERQQLVWEIDLRDPGANAQHYDDLVTRAYTVHLGGLPDWVVEWASADAEAAATLTEIDGRNSGGSGPTLVLVFEFLDERGEVVEVRDAMRVMR